jgi:hypothetical protein
VGGWIGDSGMNDLAKLDYFSREMKRMDQIEIPVRHYFAEKSYAREIVIPKDTIVLGKIHKYSHVNICSKGDISVLTPNGVVRIKAPHTVVSPAWSQKIAYTHEETVWTTFHSTELTEPDEIEKFFVVENYQEYLDYCKRLEAPCPS